jgi:tRNA1Val (adenine37-N6)-methyltransferase
VFERLNKDGKFFILLPFQEYRQFEKLAKKHNLFPLQQVNIKQTERHNFFRTIGVFKKQPATTFQESSISIKNNNEYSPEFIALLKPYYLHL